VTALTFPVEGRPPEGGALELAPGVWWLRVPLPFALDHINLWLLEDGEGWTIIDTGLRTEASRAALEKVFAAHLGDRSISRIIVTHYHPDHVGQAGWLARTYAAPLWMSRTDYYYGRMLSLDAAREIPPEVRAFYDHGGFDEARRQALEAVPWGLFAKGVEPLPASFRRLQEGEEITIGAHRWRVVIGRGHAPEHVCLHCLELDLFISGDQVLPSITSNIGVYQTEPEANPLKDWLESLDRLKIVPDSVLVLPAHGEPFSGLHARLDALKAHHRRDLDKLRAALEGEMTLARAIEVMFPRVQAGFDLMLAMGEALAHINYLVGTGEWIRQTDRDGVWRFMRA